MYWSGSWLASHPTEVDWISLGHAMWLIEVGDQRVLCDPLLGETHHCGVFEVYPPRSVHAEALNPDVIVVSHRHGDHFDIPSLYRLAQLYPQAAVVTADELVAWAARTLGFTDVTVMPVGHQAEIGGATLITTPSISPIEWGFMLGNDDGVVWNQIDTVLRSAQQAREVAQALAGFLGADRITLSLARWNPMLEIAAPLNQRTDFPHADYNEVLSQIAAVGAAWVVPASAGTMHTRDWQWMDGYAYPVSESRFLRDLPSVAPGTQGLPQLTGAVYRVRNHRIELDETGGTHLVSVRESADSRVFRPLGIPDLWDPNHRQVAEDALRERVDRWFRQDLAPALAKAFESWQSPRPLKFVVEVGYPSRSSEETVATTLVVGPDGTAMVGGFDPDWDVLNAVVGSLLWDVIEGRRHWGDVLLAGALRTANRAYAAINGGIRRLRVPDTFLYLAIPYVESEIRATKWEVDQVLRRGPLRSDTCTFGKGEEKPDGPESFSDVPGPAKPSR